MDPKVLQCLGFLLSIAQRCGAHQGRSHSQDHFAIIERVLMIIRAIMAPVYCLSSTTVLDQTFLMSCLCSAMHRKIAEESVYSRIEACHPAHGNILQGTVSNPLLMSAVTCPHMP